MRELQSIAICGRAIPELSSDAFAQLLFTTTILHERAGATNSKYPECHRKAIKAALANDPDFDRRLLEDEGFPEAVWMEFEKNCAKANTKANPRQTRGPVLQALELLREERKTSWIELLQTFSPEEAWRKLDGLSGVGPKLSSFMLREFQTFFCLWKNPPRSCWYCFNPLDRWVLRVAGLLWNDQEWPEAAPIAAEPYRELAQRIEEAGKFWFTSLAAVMDFNMGEWLLNGMRSEILAVHEKIIVGDLKDDSLHRVAMELNPEKVAHALTFELAGGGSSGTEGRK